MRPTRRPGAECARCTALRIFLQDRSKDCAGMVSRNPFYNASQPSRAGHRPGSRRPMLQTRTPLRLNAQADCFSGSATVRAFTHRNGVQHG